MGNQLLHLDAAENVFFLRELEEISAETFDVLYAELKALQMVPVVSLDAGAELWTYRQFDRVGKAKRIKDYAKDFPKVGLTAQEATQKIESYGASFGYSVQEIRAAAMANRPLERDKAETARLTLAQQLDTIASTGDSDTTLVGLLNLSNTNSYTIPNGASGHTEWSRTTESENKTPDEIIRDVNGAIRKVATDSKDVEKVTRVVLPIKQYDYIATTARSTTSDTTILNFLKGNHPGVEFMSWERLAGAGSNGADRMLCYNPNPRKVRLLLPIPFEQFAPQLVGMSYDIYCHMRVGGVVSPYPKSVLYADGI